MFHKKNAKIPYDKENLKPVIRSSICNGEQIAGFKDLHTRKFTEVMLIKDSHDLHEFLNRYELSESDIRKEW